MEDSSKNMENITQKWVKEAGIEQPSQGFSIKVMDAIQLKQQQVKVYQPLISARGWGIVAALFIISLVTVYFFPLADASYLSDLDLSKVPTIENPFKDMQVSKTMVYGIGFLALFLVQIPFLKRRFIS